MNEYCTLSAPGADEFTEKKSRFLGAAAPVQTQQQALDFVAGLKKRYWDAKHNVSAYVLRSGEQHCSDDGEPQGTAGVPVLNVLLKAGVTDAAVVVTRYFGGILLGAGGLVRAYSHGASLAVSAAGLVCMRPCLRLVLNCSYTQYGKVAALLPEHSAVVDDTAFTDTVTLRFHQSAALLPKLQEALADATAGTIQVRTEGEDFFPVPVQM